MKIFDQAAARTGLRHHEPGRPGSTGYHRRRGRRPQGLLPRQPPHPHAVHRGPRPGRLLGVQLFGHKDAEIAKRVDIAAAAIFHGMTVDQVSDLDLSYTPPLGSPWDAVQAGAQAWTRQARPS